MHAHNHLSTFIIAHLSMITQMFGMVYYPIVISDLLTPSRHAHSILPSLAVKSFSVGLFYMFSMYDQGVTQVEITRSKCLCILP